MNGTISTIESNGIIVIDRLGCDEGRTASTRGDRHGKAQSCDGCGEVMQDVNLWDADPETGDEIWLCVACGEW